MIRPELLDAPPTGNPPLKCNTLGASSFQPEQEAGDMAVLVHDAANQIRENTADSTAVAVTVLVGVIERLTQSKVELNYE